MMKTRTMMLSATAERQLKDRIDAIDLGPIKFKLVEEYGWSSDYADQVEPLYKHYLFLNATHDKVVPTKAIDEMWHTHILDTRKYHADCAAVFGEYVHHFPYFGMRGADDAIDLKRSFARTVDLFADAGHRLIDESIPKRGALGRSTDNAACTKCGGDQDSILPIDFKRFTAQAACTKCGGDQDSIAPALAA